MRKTHTLRGLEEDALDLLDVIQALRALLPEDTLALREELFRALERDDPSGALNASREAYERSGPGDRDVALTYVVLLQSRGLLEEAEGVLRKTLVAHEQDVRVQLAQVRGLGLSGRTEQAGEILDGLITYVTEPEMLGYAGDLSLDFEQPEAAIAAYKRALECSSQDHEVAYRLARLLLERGEIFDGASMLERSARLAVAQIWLWELTGDAWTEAGESERAAQAYGRAVKLEQEDEQLWLKRGMALHASGSWQEAIEALERASRLDPFLSEAWVHMGHVYLDQGYSEDAVRWYNKALAQTPDDLQALQGVTAAVFAQGDIEYAYELAKRALQIDPERMETQYNLGMILTEMSEHAQARASLERAAQLSPQSPEVWAALALCRVRTGDKEDAHEAFERAVAL
ncbi:MAG: tetratricopeptide repeat protein, partial [Myxococcota bacterium]